MKIITNTQNLNNHLADKDYRKLFPRSLDEYGKLVIFDRFETIIHQGEQPDCLFYMFSGRFKVSTYMENGKAIIIKKPEAPCMIGEIELFNHDYSFSVETLSEAIGLMFELNRCQQILLEDSHFLLQCCALLAGKERSSAIELSRTMSFPLINRLARFILDNETDGIFAIRKTIISESLGVSYRHLGKVMNDLVSEKVMQKNGLSYRIIDRDTLTRLSDQLTIF